MIWLMEINPHAIQNQAGGARYNQETGTLDPINYPGSKKAYDIGCDELSDLAAVDAICDLGSRAWIGNEPGNRFAKKSTTGVLADDWRHWDESGEEAEGT